jgi:hypothetical protein
VKLQSAHQQKHSRTACTMTLTMCGSPLSFRQSVFLWILFCHSSTTLQTMPRQMVLSVLPPPRLLFVTILVFCPNFWGPHPLPPEMQLVKHRPQTASHRQSLKSPCKLSVTSSRQDHLEQNKPPHKTIMATDDRNRKFPGRSFSSDRLDLHAVFPLLAGMLWLLHLLVAG